MLRYHFHCANGKRDPDNEGMDVADERAARQMAVQFAGEVLQSDPAQVWEHGMWRVEVTDAANVLLFTVITLAIDAPRPHARPQTIAM